MKISVIIPTHNRLTTLPRALASVVAQTRAADEIIVVDDGSTDATATWLQQHHPAVTLLQQPRAGVSAARNAGIVAASGDWVAFLDSDDEWLPTKLQRQCDALLAAPQYALCHCDELWIRNGVRVNQGQRHQKHGGWIFRHCLPLCAISPSAVIMRKSVLESLGSFDESLPACEDYDLWLRFCAQRPVLYLDLPLLKKYGGHEDQLSRHYPAMDSFRIKVLEKLLQADKLQPEQRREVVATLAFKAKIYSNGARKRGRVEEADDLEQRVRHWQQLVDSDFGASCQ